MPGQNPFEGGVWRSWDQQMRSKRALRKIEAMCRADIDVYECNACMWMVNVASTKALCEVEMDFTTHRCDKYSLSRMLAAIPETKPDTMPFGDFNADT